MTKYFYSCIFIHSSAFTLPLLSDLHHCNCFHFSLSAFPLPTMQVIFLIAARVIFLKFNSSILNAYWMKFKLSIIVFKAIHYLALAILSKLIFCCAHPCFLNAPTWPFQSTSCHSLPPNHYICCLRWPTPCLYSLFLLHAFSVSSILGFLFSHRVCL